MSVGVLWGEALFDASRLRTRYQTNENLVVDGVRWRSRSRSCGEEELTQRPRCARHCRIGGVADVCFQEARSCAGPIGLGAA